MLETVTLRLIFTGLIAFVPNDSSPTSLEALLVDARGHQYASDGCKLPSHLPALYVKAAGCQVRGREADAEVETCELSEDVAAPADKNDASGSWLLDGESISVEILLPDGERRKELRAHRSATLPAGLPATPKEAQDLAWLPAIPFSVDRNCLGAADDCPIAARFHIDDGDVTTCQLVQHPKTKVVPAFELRPLGPVAAAGGSPRAMTSAVLVSIPIPRAAKVHIVFRRLGDSCRDRLGPSRTIELVAGNEPSLTVWVTNLPRPHEEHEEMMSKGCHDAEIDRHFEMYYNLLARRVPFAQRAVPHSLGAAQAASSEKAQPADEKSCKVLDFRTKKYPLNWPACGHAWVTSSDS